MVFESETAPERVKIPPPAISASFPLTLLLLSVTSPEFVKIPPPRSLAIFPLIVLSVNVKS